MKDITTFKYKDAHRAWWKIELWDTGETEATDDTVFNKWECRVSQEVPTVEDGWHTVHQSLLYAQSGRPDATDIMASYMAYQQSIALGVCKYFTL